MVRRYDIKGNVTIHQKKDIHHKTDGKQTFKIHGGECAIAYDSDGIAISTILGSCVSVMLYDKVKKIYGMNHFLLPSSLEAEESLKYGLMSMELMINDMLKMGCCKKNMVAKIAGGAHVLESISQKIGEKNISFARDFCKAEGISIVSEDVGGDKGRVVILDRKLNTYVKYIERDYGIVEIEKAEIDRLSENAKDRTNQEVFFFD